MQRPLEQPGASRGEIDDGRWERIAPLLPVVQRHYRHPSRKRLEDRKVLSGILFVLHTGIRWEFLPQELGFGSGMTCWSAVDHVSSAPCQPYHNGVSDRLSLGLSTWLPVAGAATVSVNTNGYGDGIHGPALVEPGDPTLTE